jgi:hypothetical protein
MAQNIAEVAIALPFRIDAQGNIASSSDQSSIWADRVKSAVGTIKGTRLMRSFYGTDISEGMLTTVAEMSGVITDEITKVFSAQFPTLTLLGVSVDWDDSQNTIQADVLYKLPSQDEAKTQVGIASLSSNNQLSEVNL